MLAFSYSLEMQGSASTRTTIWAIALTNYVFTARAMFIVNYKTGAFAGHYSLSIKLDIVYGCLLFCLFYKILDPLNYLGFYKLARRMSTDPVLTVWQ